MPPAPPPHKRHVTFCTRCESTPNIAYNNDDRYNDDCRDPPLTPNKKDDRYYSDPGRNPPLSPTRPKDDRYYSDPGRDPPLTPIKKTDDSDDQRYYSEPDAKNYFEIDYEFLKELRKIARNNCPKCKRKRSRKETEAGPVKTKQRSYKARENYVFCNGRYHSDKEHCQLCCKICNKSTDTLDSIDDDQYSLVSRSYSRPRAKSSSKTSSLQRPPKERKNSVQSNKSVSFLESSNDEKDEPNYTAKSFTNDLKKFLLKPSTPKQSLRDKFMSSIKQEFEAKKKSPKLKAIKGLWKSY